MLQHFVHNVQFSAESRGLGAILFMGLSKSKFIKAAKSQKVFSILPNVHKNERKRLMKIILLLFLNMSHTTKNNFRDLATFNRITTRS